MDAAFRNWDPAKRYVLKKVHVGSLFQVVDYAIQHDGLRIILEHGLNHY
ncbi:hypothetical protein [Paenibacillus amylolyticus]